MKTHPISKALRYLKGKLYWRAVPGDGYPAYPSTKAAVDELRRLTGQDFGTDIKAWEAWLTKHRSIYHGGMPEEDKGCEPGHARDRRKPAAT